MPFRLVLRKPPVIPLTSYPHSRHDTAHQQEFMICASPCLHVNVNSTSNEMETYEYPPWKPNTEFMTAKFYK